MSSSTAAGPADKQSLCIDILTSGFVQSFVDFFYLTHRPEGKGGEGGAESHPTIPPGKLTFVKSHLAEAEAARRQGDTKAVFASYQGLADFFTELADQRTAVYFWEKCLELAKLTTAAEGEAKATRALGVAHEALGDRAAALGYYEKLLRIVQAADDADGVKTANEHLVVAYRAMAKELEGGGADAEQALGVYEKRLAAAVAAGDAAKQGIAHFELGKAHEATGEVEQVKKAVEHYTKYLDLCAPLEDVDGQGAACSALAHAHARLDDSATSVAHLQKFLSLAQASGKLQGQAEACCSLGVLYQQQGDFANAVHHLERFFEIARSIGDRALVDKARVYLGIARGNSMLPKYLDVVTHDLDALLRWKTRRVAFAS